MSGYQSSCNSSADEPIVLNTSIAYGVTTMIDENLFELQLDPPLEQLTEEMILHVRFDADNTGHASLNVDGLGAVPIMAIVNGSILPLEADSLLEGISYLLLFSEERFIVQLTYVTPPRPTVTRVLQMGENDLDAVYNLIENRDSYSILNENMVLVNRLHLRSDLQVLDGEGFQLPIPEDSNFYMEGVIFNQNFEMLRYTMENDGILRLFGEMSNPDDLLYINIPSYIAELPIAFSENF